MVGTTPGGFKSPYKLLLRMSSIKLNPGSQANPDTGFGTQANQIGGRFVNKDGSFNLRKEGMSPLKRLSFYSILLELPGLTFLTGLVASFLLINIVFSGVYLFLGENELQGFARHNYWGHVREVFYFSMQTFTTVGYGRLNPIGDLANIIASLESMTGWLFFAIVTGLVYGRFTRPKAFIAFSHNALIAPFKNGKGLMFRMVPFKSRHHLTDAKVIVTVSFILRESEKQEYQFFQLALERARVDMFNMNWTVVHPIDENSPLLNFTENDLAASDLELLVQVTGFDPLYSNTVMQRTSYNYEELIWGAKFKPMYHESPESNSTVLELNKLNAFERVMLAEEDFAMNQELASGI